MAINKEQLIGLSYVERNYGGRYNKTVFTITKFIDSKNLEMEYMYYRKLETRRISIEQVQRYFKDGTYKIIEGNSQKSFGLWI